jgi:hypothetical protein
VIRIIVVDDQALIRGGLVALFTAAPGLEVVGELTPRETEILRLVGNGLTNAQIAQRLVLSEATVTTHVLRRCPTALRSAPPEWARRRACRCAERPAVTSDRSHPRCGGRQDGASRPSA